LQIQVKIRNALELGFESQRVSKSYCFGIVRNHSSVKVTKNQQRNLTNNNDF